ncbi:hypothetical protein [Streptomyces sp. AN091965]|nr:hypothetical protein [Streptomyces sp. AN091965]
MCSRRPPLPGWDPDDTWEPSSNDAHYAVVDDPTDPTDYYDH